MRLRLVRALAVAPALLLTLTFACRHLWHWRALYGHSPYKVFVVLGFHANFYHSWRGDTPDEAGFGTDIRVVREILRTLDEANAQGLDARGYWESENLFTLESILPKHAPDIVAGIRRRIDAGRDEALLAPYNNGFFSAMTEDEVRAALRWAVANPWGSGVRDLYGSYTALLRPQEGMFTPGLIPLLREEGIRGLVLAYSSYPFTTFSNFVPPLPPAQRFGVTWLRTEPGGPRIPLFPCVSPGDVVDFVSLKKWLLELRELQVSGAVKSDLVVHLNFDADAESWLPLRLPRGLGWLPNTGGLREYIETVNRFEWARFTTPGEYLATHEPAGEVVFGQDTADGAWDGYYSWSEKLASQELWTRLEQSRLLAQHFDAFAAGLPAAARERLHERYIDGREGAFFQRLRTLSTTHFGMSTPVVNEERYAAGAGAAEAAYSRTLQALREAAPDNAAGGSLYTVEVRDTRRSGDAAFTLVRIPVLLPEPVAPLSVRTADGARLPAARIDIDRLDGAWAAAEIAVPMSLSPGDAVVLRIEPDDAATLAVDAAGGVLRNDAVELASSVRGISRLRAGDVEIGADDFLAPFLTYRSADTPVSFGAGDWQRTPLEGESGDGLARLRLRNAIRFDTPDGPAAAELQADFTLPDSAPWVVADVRVRYPYTAKRDALATPQQQLRRLVDRRWVEVAPFQLLPRLDGRRERPLRVWKRNYLGVTSVYELDAARINPRNADVDSFNNHVTAAWMALSDHRHGLLLAQSAESLASPNFAPLRLREDDGRQVVRVNPFGSYHGRQLDYSHLGGNGLGTQFAELVGSALRANAPSFNGRTQRFSLLIAPYAGDEPPANLQAAAEAFFHPPALVYRHAPPGIDARLPADIRAKAESLRRAAAASRTEPLPAPRAFLANPTDGAVDLVWDAPDDPGAQTFEVEWKPAAATSWQRLPSAAAQRRRLGGLTNGERIEARVRARGGERESPWTEPQSVTVGPVGTQSALNFAERIGPRFAASVAYVALVHLLTTP